MNAEIEQTNKGWWVIKGDTHIGKWVKQNERLDFDQNALPFILAYLKPGDWVIDAGANIGAYSFAFLHKVGLNGKVICFEPNPIAFECLYKNIGNHPNCFPFHSFLSNKISEYEIVNETQNFGMAYGKESDKNKGICSTYIDALDLEKLDFIKIDVEGMELEVLEGASKTIERFNPVMYIEINEATLSRNNSNKQAIFDFLDEHGYSYKNIYPGQEMTGEQFDIICTK